MTGAGVEQDEKMFSAQHRSFEADNVQRAFDAPLRNISRSSINHSRSQKHKMSDASNEAPRRRRDSWDNPVLDELPANSQHQNLWDSSEQEKAMAGGIGKLKISREMKAKLEALTSSHPTRFVCNAVSPFYLVLSKSSIATVLIKTFK